MFPTLYTPEQHYIFDSEVARWVCRNAPAGWNDRLFTYHHEDTGNFVVAVWAKEPFWLLSDIINLGKNMSNFNQVKRDELMRRMWAPDDPIEMAKQINQQERDFNSQRMDKQEELKGCMARRKE